MRIFTRKALVSSFFLLFATATLLLFTNATRKASKNVVNHYSSPEFNHIVKYLVCLEDAVCAAGDAINTDAHAGAIRFAAGVCNLNVNANRNPESKNWRFKFSEFSESDSYYRVATEFINTDGKKKILRFGVDCKKKQRHRNDSLIYFTEKECAENDMYTIEEPLDSVYKAKVVVDEVMAPDCPFGMKNPPECNETICPKGMALILSNEKILDAKGEPKENAMGRYLNVWNYDNTDSYTNNCLSCGTVLANERYQTYSPDSIPLEVLDRLQFSEFTTNKFGMCVRRGEPCPPDEELINVDGKDICTFKCYNSGMGRDERGHCLNPCNPGEISIFNEDDKVVCQKCNDGQTTFNPETGTHGNLCLDEDSGCVGWEEQITDPVTNKKLCVAKCTAGAKRSLTNPYKCETPEGMCEPYAQLLNQISQNDFSYDSATEYCTQGEGEQMVQQLVENVKAGISQALDICERAQKRGNATEVCTDQIARGLLGLTLANSSGCLPEDSSVFKTFYQIGETQIK